MKNLAYIDGKWTSGAEGVTFVVEDPASDEVIASVPDLGVEDCNRAVEAASKAFSTFKQTSAKERSDLLIRIRDQLLKNAENIATVLTRENGKPLKESKGEVNFAASFFEWFAGEARRAYGETIPAPVNGKQLMTIRQPLGVASLITPWNFPIGMIARKVAAALAAGCTCVIKPPEDCPLTAIAFAQVCEDAGVPAGVINVVTCSRAKVAEIGEILSTHPKISVVSFTGSTDTGKWLCARGGSTLKRLHMELGGNAPFIVFNDADVDSSINNLIISKFRNSGQTCITANRILIQEEIYEEFKNKFVEAVKTLTIGSGLTDPDIGPLINDRQFQRLDEILSTSVNQGAKIVYGGNKLEKLGKRFFQPTVVTNITPNMRLYSDEIFGPIAPLISFKTEEEALTIANDMDRGLAGFFYTRDVRRAFKFARELEVGMVGVNDAIISTCEAPFGGVKSSGFGIEGSSHGMDEYSTLKYVCFGAL